MPILTYPEFRPDLPDLDSGFVDYSKGVLPGAGCLLPLPQTAVYSGALTGGRCLGAIAVRKTADTVDIYAGTGTTLEKLNLTTQAWANVSKAGNYTVTSGHYWSFTLFGTTLIAVTNNVAPQFIDIDGGGLFADLTVSPPTARYGAIVNQFMVLAGWTSQLNKMQWSAIGDATGWTALTNQSDTQTFPSGGKIMGITGGRTNGSIYQENVIRRMTYVGGDAIFRIDEVVDDIGLLSPYGITSIFGSDYFYSGKGFMRLNPDGSIDRIGSNKIDKWFVDNSDNAKFDQIIAATDPIQKLVWFLYHSNQSTTDYQDAALVYSWETDEWRPIEQTASFMAPMTTPGTTLEGVEDVYGYTDVETIPYGFDDRFWSGGSPIHAVFQNDDKMHLFSGSNRAAEVETGLFQLNPGGRSFVQGISPIIEVGDAQGSPSAKVCLGSRNLPWDDITWSSTAGTAVNAVAGEAPFEISGRDFKARVKIPASESWKKQHGIRQPRYRQDGWM